MKKIISILTMYIFKLLPLSRFFVFKTKLLKFSGIDIATNARIFSSVQIFGPKYIHIGNDTFIGHESLLTGSYNSKINIGNYVDIAPRVIINTGSHEIDIEGLHIAGKGKSADINIKDGAWIGMGSSILPGVTIGEKAIIAAGSVVINDVVDFTMVAGTPAIFKRDLK